MSNPSICARCHSLNQGCCFLQPETSEYMFGLSNSEIVNIAKQTKMNESEFVIEDIVKEGFVASLRQMDDNFKFMFPNRLRKKLMIKDDKCIFLSDNGCILSSENRPFYCRMYPFWFNNEGLFVIQSKTCLVQENASIHNMMLKLETTELKLMQLYDAWLEGIEKHYNSILNISS
jgi:Fe-S-cluster containining protein